MPHQVMQFARDAHPLGDARVVRQQRLRRPQLGVYLAQFVPGCELPQGHDAGHEREQRNAEKQSAGQGCIDHGDIGHIVQDQREQQALSEQPGHGGRQRQRPGQQTRHDQQQDSAQRGLRHRTHAQRADGQDRKNQDPVPEAGPHRQRSDLVPVGEAEYQVQNPQRQILLGGERHAVPEADQDQGDGHAQPGEQPREAEQLYGPAPGRQIFRRLHSRSRVTLV